ncbi:MAG: elongation factor P [Caldilineae bacterium]|nr:MAG: elongation factor P [Caldilineae bacterium]
MIGVEQLRKGVIFTLDGELYRVLDYEHRKMARGSATIRVKVRNLRSGATIEKTFPNGQRVQDVRLDHATVQYLYHDDQFYYFMDNETFEQTMLKAEQLGDSVNYLVDGMEIKLETYEGEPISIELPSTVDLEVVEAEPGFAGDTANAPSKWCTTETGLRVQVPLFVEAGDRIRVNTETGEYVTRV